MTRYGHNGWRVVAMMTAFAGTAVLAVTLTRVPQRTEAALSADSSCLTSGLRASLGLGQAGTWGTGVTGTEQQTPPIMAGRYFTLEFTNVSHRLCSLFGYPEVSAYAASQTSSGQPGAPSPADSLGGAAIQDPSVRPQRVRLEPGQTAQASLRITDTADTRSPACVRVNAEELRVTLPHQGRAAFVPVHIPVCSAPGRLSLSVQPLQARSGVSGFTMP